ncbi:MAG: VPLPA-CTERM sorting domain-containing protein [Deltaproteobacteria bacterium]|nr:VPLPA-CTERM sorting domain-containing protein [Deltaproteobacteria bacterium]MBW1934852.1 VPLPA-CTERM sorting domain-containing protein [Deltaproteobacteria bacterium]
MKRLKFGSIAIAAVFLTMLMAGTAGASFTFDDIDFWVGTGSNQAALVVDWNDSKDPQSLAWGYRWDGTASGEDMMRAIAGSGIIKEPFGGATTGNWDNGADGRLYARMTTWWGNTARTVYGLGYDLDNDGGTFVPGYEGKENGYATDPDDHYAEGWYTGYWSYWLEDDLNNIIGDSWSYSGTGMTGRTLTDGCVDGWSYSDFASFGAGAPPDEPVPAPVPIPSAVWLLGSGLVGLIGIRRRSRI